MKSPKQEKLKDLRTDIDKILAGRSVSDEKIQTIGKALFDLVSIFHLMEKK